MVSSTAVAAAGMTATVAAPSWVTVTRMRTAGMRRAANVTSSAEVWSRYVGSVRFNVVIVNAKVTAVRFDWSVEGRRPPIFDVVTGKDQLLRLRVEGEASGGRIGPEGVGDD